MAPTKGDGRMMGKVKDNPKMHVTTCPKFRSEPEDCTCFKCIECGGELEPDKMAVCNACWPAFIKRFEGIK